MLRRWLLIGLCGLPCLLPGLGCVSINKGGRPLGSIIGQIDVPPQPGDWCRVELVTQRRGPMSRQLGFLTGQVATANDSVFQLTNVTEEKRVLNGPIAVRKVPFLSRMTSVDSEFDLKQARQIPRDQIAAWHVITENEALRDRQSLVQVGDKLVRERIGIDFDFNVTASRGE